MNNYIKIATIFLTLLAVSFGVYKNFITNEIVVKVGFCLKNESEDYPYLATYIIKNNKIYQKLQPIDEKKSMDVGLVTLLDDCTIIDINNWSCGGKLSLVGNTAITEPLYSVINGKFKYLNGSFHEDCIVKIKQVN